MHRASARAVILEVAKEYGYATSGTAADAENDVYFDRRMHGIAFQIRNSNSLKGREGGWLQVHHYEGEPEEWGPALHSLRTWGDVIAFCQVLITFAQIKSKRREEVL